MEIEIQLYVQISQSLSSCILKFNDYGFEKSMHHMRIEIQLHKDMSLHTVEVDIYTDLQIVHTVQLQSYKI